MTPSIAKIERTTKASIRRAGLFRALAPSALTRLAASATALNIARGELICRRGDCGLGVYVVLKGGVMLYVGAPTGTKVVELVGPGGHIGLMPALLGIPQPLNAETLADSALLLIPRAALHASITGNADLALQLAVALGQEVRRLTADIESFALCSGHERVASYLLEISVSNGGQPRVATLPAKKSIIASRLSLTPEYFSRMLHEMIASGAIAVSGRQITILDSSQLGRRKS